MGHQGRENANAKREARCPRPPAQVSSDKEKCILLCGRGDASRAVWQKEQDHCMHTTALGEIRRCGSEVSPHRLDDYNILPHFKRQGKHSYLHPPF